MRQDRGGDKRGADEPSEARTLKSWEQEVDVPEVILVPTRDVCRTVRGDRPSQRCLADNTAGADFTFTDRAVSDSSCGSETRRATERNSRASALCLFVWVFVVLFFCFYNDISLASVPQKRQFVVLLFI